jgi:hypothetical protein
MKKLLYILYHLTDALPAVTVPFFLKIAGNLARPSMVVFGRGCSSISNISFPEKLDNDNVYIVFITMVIFKIDLMELFHF